MCIDEAVDADPMETVRTKQGRVGEHSCGESNAIKGALRRSDVSQHPSRGN